MPRRLVQKLDLFCEILSSYNYKIGLLFIVFEKC